MGGGSLKNFRTVPNQTAMLSKVVADIHQVLEQQPAGSRYTDEASLPDVEVLLFCLRFIK